jgi:hypothetical protein
MPTDAVSSEMQRRAREAVKMAATVYGEELDFTEPTVEIVERILSSLGADHELSDDDRARVVWVFGPYLGEVVRQRFPDARWERYHPTYDQAGPYLKIADIQLFPLVWCYKRLYNGPEESVALKYRAFREAHAARAGEANPNAAPDRGPKAGRQVKPRKGRGR